MRYTRILWFLLIVSVTVSCDEGGNSEKPAVAITTSAAVEALGLRVMAVVNALLADVPDRTELLIEDEVAPGPDGGSVTMNGAADYSKSSSSSSTLENYSLDVTMVFTAYKSEALTLEGPLRYAEYYRYRFACSSGGCASSTHASKNYVSTTLDASVAQEQPVIVEFEVDGVRYRDTVVIDIEDDGGSSVLMRLTTQAGDEFIVYI